MKSLLFAFVLLSNLFGEDSFITKSEYGEQLYKKPRGIGCSNCHGKGGSGMKITSYLHKKKKKEIIAPSIRFLSAKKIEEGVNKHPSFVPKYFLVEDEYKSLEAFLEKK
ncbi:MAG: cytochrome c [Campylobacterales bacterium]|nr:cytochrome c [Campylobacterales bacterium]